MFRYLIKYLSFFGCIMLAFVNFISCGLQLYKISLDEDTAVDAPYDDRDPDSEYYGIHSKAGWESLPITFWVGANFDKDFNPNSEEQLQGILKAIKTWEMAVGKKLFEFRGVHKDAVGDTFVDLYSSLKDTFNGYYMDEDWNKTNKPEVVLATTIWERSSSEDGKIRTSDIRFNNNFYVFGDSMTLQYDESRDREVVDMESLALHELGHLLGLGHVDEDVDGFSVMNPSMLIGSGLSSRGISKGDILRIQKIYGCHGDACDMNKLIVKLRDRYHDAVSEQDLADL